MTESDDLGALTPQAQAQAPAAGETPPTESTRLRRQWRLWRLQRLGLARPRLTAGLALFLIVNALLAFGYLWSQGGQSTTVRVEARGDQFAVAVDGTHRVQQAFDAPAQGGVMLTLQGTTDIPSLPSPRGIDRVQVTDLETDDLLFEDDFSSGPGPEWTVVSGAFESEDGVAGVEGSGILLLEDQAWRDYAVDVRFKNVTSASVMVRAPDASNGVSYSFRPFRHLDSNLTLVEDGLGVEGASGGAVQLKRSETIRSMVAMVLRPYPLALGLLVAGVIVVAALQFVRLRPFDTSALSGAPELAVGTLAAAAFGVTLVIISSYGARMPHVPDEVSYIFQAKNLASLQLSAPLPPVEEAFEFFYPPLIVQNDGHWASVYPFGHSLVLAIGERLGAIWLIPPLLGAATVVLLSRIGQRVYNTRVGVLAALLLATSPFFLMTSSNLMSHNTGAFYIVASLTFLAFIDRRPWLYGVLAGLFFGLLFNTRPLTAFALMPPFGALLLSRLAPAERRRQGLEELLSFVAGGLIMLLAYLIYNYGAFGDALSNGYQQSGSLDQVVGFGNADHTVNRGIQNEQTQLTFLLLVFNGWPLYLGLTLVLLPFILATRRLWDWFLLACALFAIGAWAWYVDTGIMHGPRYWYEAMPFLILLAARGADRAIELLADGARAVRRALFDDDRRPEWAATLVVGGFVVVFAGLAVAGWLFGKQDGWQADFVPDRATDLRGFNDADDRLLKLVDEADIHHALVLVEQCPHWQCYGTVFWRNSPELDGDIVYAVNLPERRAELFARYPDRAVYEATYSTPSLRVFGGGPVPTGEDEPPRGSDIDLPTPVPTATPDPAEAQRRDEQRRADLEAIRGALEQYRQEHDEYPLAENVQSFCTYPFDSGCAVEEFLSPLPKDPKPDATYWYSSDGASFYLYAAMETDAGPSGCPDPLPGHFAGVPNLYCVRGP